MTRADVLTCQTNLVKHVDSYAQQESEKHLKRAGVSWLELYSIGVDIYGHCFYFGHFPIFFKEVLEFTDITLIMVSICFANKII